METVIFQCSLCKIALTNPLQHLLDITRLSEEDAMDHVPPGFYWIAPSPELDGGYYSEASGQYLVNLKDIVNTKYHTKIGRLNGCCGLDGCDGMNVLCLNGHEVGTERSDCWMAHSLALDPQAVSVVMQVESSKIV